MIEVETSASGVPVETTVPRKEWCLLPLLSILTIGLLIVSAELLSRHMFSATKVTAEDCMVFNDPTTGVRAIPNSVCWEKIPESQLVDYRFNSCGHRTDLECGSKHPSTFRIVMTGSSYAAGMRLPKDKAFAALLPVELTRRTERQVELYNEGTAWRTPHVIDLHFNEILAARPDMILWIIVPSDVEHVSVVLPQIPSRNPAAKEASAPVKPSGFMARAWRRVNEGSAKGSILTVVDRFHRRALNEFKATRTGFMLQHFLYTSRSQFLKSYLMRGDDDTGYLKAEPSPEWQSRLRQFDGYAADIEAQAKAAGVPLVAVLLPKRAEVAMISAGDWPAGYDPYKLDNELRSSIVSHGGIYIDILPGFRNIPNADQNFFPVDGHPDVPGSLIVSRLLATKLTGGAVPALKSVPEPQAALEQRR